MRPNSRGITFAASIQMVKELQEEMKCFTHYSQQKTVNTINMERWKEGYTMEDGHRISQIWMAATPGLINGIDLDNIDGVLLGEEGMAGMFGAVQGTGRGG